MTKNQNVQVSVSENLLHWTSPLSFLYLAPVPFTPLQPIQFTWVKYASITLVVLCTICLIIYAISQKKLTHGYELVEEYIPIGREYVIDSEELKFEEIIGRGSFGNVYRGQWRHTEVAIKRIHNTSQSFIDELYREAELMIALRHPNIVTFMACTTKPDVCLVTEFISRGSLYGILHNKSILISPEHVRRMALDACKGMEYLHSARIIHRDLKSHNLLVDKAWAIKVADFGLSRHLEESFAKEMTACGTPCWTAPEVIRNEHYDMSADVYSFGVCLWEMMSRSDPFPGMPPMQVVLAVAQNKQRPPIDPSWHPAICNIIQSCFEDKPTLRPTFGELILKLHSLDLPPAPPNPIILNLDERKSTDIAF
uniref:Protein kinase domain-containing protein n=1 Tax=Arcella intermedia TaxID=1963864 RepID=A0A6B2L7C1_9EUKA